MRLSRLHILLGLISIGVAGYVIYQQKQTAEQSRLAASSVPAVPKVPAVAEAMAGKPAAPSVPAVASVPAAPTVPAVASVPSVYKVLRGDTLWAIARHYSPAKAGAAWVGIWKANKKIIKDFDNLEAGLELTIPQERRAYFTAFWKPRYFEVAQIPQEVDLAEVFRQVPAVDLAELPVKGLDLEVAVAELPLSQDSLGYEFAVSALPQPIPLFVSYR